MILIDANIFMYAAGRESPEKIPSQSFLDKIVESARPDACTDAEVLQEILHRYRSMGQSEVGLRLFDLVLQLSIPVLPVTVHAMTQARQLVAGYPSLSTRDALHLGVMRDHGLHRVLSYDRDFSEVPWVLRIEP